MVRVSHGSAGVVCIRALQKFVIDQGTGFRVVRVVLDGDTEVVRRCVGG